MFENRAAEVVFVDHSGGLWAKYKILGADSRYPLQSFDKKRFPYATLRAILFAKGFPLLSGLELFWPAANCIKFKCCQATLFFSPAAGFLTLPARKPKNEVQRTPLTNLYSSEVKLQKSLAATKVR